MFSQKNRTKLKQTHAHTHTHKNPKYSQTHKCARVPNQDALSPGCAGCEQRHSTVALLSRLDRSLPIPRIPSFGPHFGSFFFFFGENDLGTPNKAAWATGEFLKQRKPHKMEKAPPDGTKARAWGQQAARCPGCEVPSLPGRVWVLSGHPSHSPPRPRPSFPHAPTHMRGPSRVHGCK